MLTLRAHAAAGRVGNDLRRRHHPQPLWARAAPEKFMERPFKGIPAVCRRVEYESQCLTAAGVAESSRAGSGWAALAVQQAHNERSGRAGRARGVGTGGGMRTREGVGAARQGAGAPANGRNRTGILRPTLWHASDPPWMGAAAVRLGHANRTKKVPIY